MTDHDERTINRAIAMLGDRYDSGTAQDLAEEARAALHRLFRDRRRLERQVEKLTKRLAEANRTDAFYRYHKGVKS